MLHARLLLGRTGGRTGLAASGFGRGRALPRATVAARRLATDGKASGSDTGARLTQALEAEFGGPLTGEHKEAAAKLTQLLSPQAPSAARLAEMAGDYKRLSENAFVREREGQRRHAEETVGLWRKISIYVCIPALALAAANAYVLWKEHWEHWEHMPPLEERPEYPYQNIRTKNYPFGNGDETLFWNKETNYHNHDKVK